MTIGELARRSGVNAKTIRFYGEIGLLEPSGRTPSGYRLYDASSVDRLQAIRLAKQAGLRLEEIRNLVALMAGQEVRCADVLPLLELKVQEVADQVRSLAELRDYLEQTIRTCRRAQRKGTTVVCPMFSPGGAADVAVKEET
ncbi:MAG: MerR family transcriptional regulator [Gemmatimonadota bacterium]